MIGKPNYNVQKNTQETTLKCSSAVFIWFKELYGVYCPVLKFEYVFQIQQLVERGESDFTLLIN
jgi:hypothetical protein